MEKYLYCIEIIDCFINYFYVNFSNFYVLSIYAYAFFLLQPQIEKNYNHTNHMGTRYNVKSWL